LKRLDKSWERQALNAFNRSLSVALPLSVKKEQDGMKGGRWLQDVYGKNKKGAKAGEKQFKSY